MILVQSQDNMMRGINKTVTTQLKFALFLTEVKCYF